MAALSPRNFPFLPPSLLLLLAINLPTPPYTASNHKHQQLQQTARMPLVLPGDTIRVRSRGGDDSRPSGYIKLGPGLLPSQTAPETQLTAIRPGASGHLSSSSISGSSKATKNSDAYWIETNTARVSVPVPETAPRGLCPSSFLLVRDKVLTLSAHRPPTSPRHAVRPSAKRLSHRPNHRPRL